MKYILYLFLIINTSLFAQDTLSFSEEFIVPFDVFKKSNMGEIRNLGVEFSDLYLNYFIPSSEFESNPDFERIFITNKTIQDIFLNNALSEYRNNNPLEINSDSACLNLRCYINYSFERKTNRYWRKNNQGDNLKFTKFYCEFICIKLGKHKVKIVSPSAQCKRRAYRKKEVDVYLISSIKKVIPIET